MPANRLRRPDSSSEASAGSRPASAKTGRGFSPAGVLLLLLLAALACARGTPPATAPPPPLRPGGTVTPSPLPLRGIPATVTLPAVPANAFAPYLLPEESEGDPAGPDDEPDADALANRDALTALDGPQRTALLAQGFVALPEQYPTFADLYREAAARELPLFVTVDSAAHALDLLADVAWLRAEQTLAADLHALSAGLVAATLAQWEQAPDDATVAATRRNLAFFAVGLRLQDPGAEIPAPVAGLVQDELTLIAQGGTFLSPLFDVTRDYGAFQPAGPYAADPALAGYYQARQWYAQPFALTAADPPAARRNGRQLLLLTAAVHSSENYSRWQRIYAPLAYGWGTEGGWTVVTLTQAAEALYGEVPPAAEAADLAALEDYIATVQAFPPAPVSVAPPAEAVFRLLPAPVPPDRLWLESFVFNQVGTYNGPETQTPLTLVETAIGPVRGLPRVLDLAAAQGGAAAALYLESTADDAFTGYETQLERARTTLAGREPATWTQSWAGGWHYSLHPLLAPPRSLPFMEDAIWEAKALSSWHGGWVRLQTPTLLAPRPVAPEVPVLAQAGYVEPYPAVYGRLAALARQLHTGLDRYRLLDEEAGEKLLRLERLLLGFRGIATKELAGEPLTEDEVLLLRQAGLRLENLLTFAPPAGSNVPLTEGGVVRILDVYPTPGGDELLQAGVGGVWPLYVLVPGAEGETVVAMGGMLASYELRVTREEKWETETWSEGVERADPAGWTDAFLKP